MPFKPNDSLISVIITTYNRALMIGKAINSVLNQTYRNFELIIIDDGSQDNTKEIVKEWQKKSDKIRYKLLTSNYGANIARNEGIKLSKGNYLAFLDSDDEWFPQKLEKQIEIFRNSKDPKLGIVYCGMIKKYSKGLISFKNDKKSGNLFQNLLISNFIGGASVPLIRRKVFENCGMFNKSKVFQKGGSQDYEMWLRIASKYNFGVVPEILVKYNIIKDSVSLNSEFSNPSKRIKARLFIWRKYWTYFEKYKKPYTSLIIAIGPGLIRLGKTNLATKYLKSAVNFTPHSFNLYYHLLLIRVINKSSLILMLWDSLAKIKSLVKNSPFFIKYFMYRKSLLN
ncbi:glycosyltransferase family 2 protein [Candidatus Harpocratesius sp.]